MNPIYIVLIVTGCLLVLFFVMALLLYNKVFGKRWEPNGITKYYEYTMYEGLKREPLEFKMGRNTLRGYLYFYDQDSYKGIMVVCHGMWGSHRAYIQEIEYFARNGFKVFGFDYVGTELSDGKSIKGLGNSLACVNSAVSFIKEEFKGEDIFVFGHSWGGFAAIGVSKYHQDIKGIVAMAPFSTVSKILSGFTSKWLGFFIPFCLIIDFFRCGWVSFTNNKRVLDKTSVKTLILHSKDDKVVKYDKHSLYLQKTKNPNVKFLILDNKNHNPDYTIRAINYTYESFKKAKALSGEEKIEFLKSLDYQLMGELDEEVMNKIIDFYNQNCKE